MKVLLFSVIFLWALIELPQLALAAPYDPSFVIAYNRSADIEKHCRSFLTSALELEPDDESRGRCRLKTELSFNNGDWEQQETDHGAVVPLLHELHDDHDKNDSQSHKFVSFEVNDVNSFQQLKNTVSLGGVLRLGISTNTSCAFTGGLVLDRPRTMNPCTSVMAFNFEGFYMETKDNNGRGRLMCLLASSTEKFDCEIHELSEFGRSWYCAVPQTRYLQDVDDRVLLLLRYPKTFNLSKTAIRGEMVSLNKHGDSRYFSKVYIYSQFEGPSKYQFVSELRQQICNIVTNLTLTESFLLLLVALLIRPR